MIRLYLVLNNLSHREYCKILKHEYHVFFSVKRLEKWLKRENEQKKIYEKKIRDNINYRVTVKETNGDNEEQSQVTINRTDREDSGVYKCQAQNAYGRSEHLINLAVQERPDPPGFLEVVEVSSRSVRLAWRRSFDGNSPILGYLVQYQPLGIEHVDWEIAGTQNLTLPAISTTIRLGIFCYVLYFIIPVWKRTKFCQILLVSGIILN